MASLIKSPYGAAVQPFATTTIVVLVKNAGQKMIRKRTILDDSQTASVVATVVLFAFVYGVFVGYSGKMLYIDSSKIQTKDTLNGRFGQIVKTL